MSHSTSRTALTWPTSLSFYPCSTSLRLSRLTPPPSSSVKVGVCLREKARRRRRGDADDDTDGVNGFRAQAPGWIWEFCWSSHGECFTCVHHFCTSSASGWVPRRKYTCRCCGSDLWCLMKRSLSLSKLWYSTRVPWLTQTLFLGGREKGRGRKGVHVFLQLPLDPIFEMILTCVLLVGKSHNFVHLCFDSFPSSMSTV